MVVGWSMSDNMTTTDTIIKTWKMAVNNRPICDDLLFHSDRGIQYASKEFTTAIANPLITQSMSRKGNCWDNAVAESFFKSLKTECVYRNNFTTRKEAEIAIFIWIESWYNKNRIHSALGNKSITDFNNQNKNQTLAA
jgi:transposase InsO family protein